MFCQLKNKKMSFVFDKESDYSLLQLNRVGHHTKNLWPLLGACKRPHVMSITNGACTREEINFVVHVVGMTHIVLERMNLMSCRFSLGDLSVFQGKMFNPDISSVVDLLPNLEHNVMSGCELREWRKSSKIASRLVLFALFFAQFDGSQHHRSDDAAVSSASSEARSITEGSRSVTTDTLKFDVYLCCEDGSSFG